MGKKLPSCIAVPTTARTGAETTIAAVITDSETHHKYALMDLHLVPKYAVLDPEKTRAFIDEIRAMNRRMSIPTGFDFVREEDVSQMIRQALAEANPVYPVPVVYDIKRCEKVIRRIIAEA